MTKKKNVWKNEDTSPVGSVADLLDEAKKDNFPLGTLRLYTGKMANGNVSSHIYVKVGGKKPWAYYATYPSAKASAAIASGAMIVVDGKVTGPATPENCALFGVKHPYAGKVIPPLVKGGAKPLGSVGTDGSPVINPDSVKEMENAIAVAKGEEPAPTTGETPVAPAPEPPSAPVVPEPEPVAPEPDWPDVLGSIAKAVNHDLVGGPLGMNAWTKAHPALSTLISQRYGLKAADVAFLAAQVKHSGFASTVKSNGAKEGDSGAAGLIYDAIKKVAQDLGVPLDAPPALKVNVVEVELAIDAATDELTKATEKTTVFVDAMTDLYAGVNADPTAESIATVKNAALKTMLSAFAAREKVTAALEDLKAQFAKEPQLGSVLSFEASKKFNELQDNLEDLNKTLSKYQGTYQELENVIDNALTDKLAKKQAEKKSLEALVQYLKDIGFYDPDKQQDILSSPTVQKQLAAKYGKDWQAKAAAGAAALGVPLAAATKPPVSGGVVTAPTVNPAPPKPVEKPAPAPVVPTAGGSLPLPSLPFISALKKGASAKALGGAGKKDYYSLGKEKYLIKLAFEKDGSGKAKPFAAVAQEIFSTVALAVRPDHVPIRVDKDETGATVTVQPFYEGASTLEGVDPSTLNDQDQLDVATEHLLDWMLSQHDSYAGNLIRRKDGRIVGVDKEQAFRFFPHDQLDVDYNPNPIEPYYNGFWRAFRDGKMDFDVQGLQDTVDKIEAISDTAYSEQLQKYAQSIWPTEPTKQTKFIKAALERKQNLRPDYEKFVTDLYRKRTGKMSGTFTFKHGWNEAGGVATPVKKSMQKVTAKEWAIHLQIQEKEFLPTEGPNKGQPDPTKLVLRVHNAASNKAVLEQFLKDTGITPIGPIFTGKTYHMVVVDKKTYQSTHFEKELEKPIEIDPEDSAAVVDLEPHKAAEMNNQDLAQVETAQLGPLGMRFSSDALGVEGQYMRVRRILDKSGKPFYQFQFKLRPALAATLTPGASGKYEFPKLAYQPGSDSLVESGEHVHTLNGRKYKSGSSDAFFYGESDKYTFMNSVTMRIRPKAGQSVQQAFAETLEAMRPGLAAELLKNPTPEEREIAKLARLYWAADPLKADALSAADHNLVELKKRLGKLGFSDADYAKVEERETYPGLQSHVLPGRHKKLAGGKFRFMMNGISDLPAAVSVLKLGLLGISERAAAGITLKGGSVPQDIVSGAGDQILARPVTESGLSASITSHAFHGTYQAIIDPSEADRLDCYVHMQDAYGSCNPVAGNGSHAWNARKTVEACMTQQQQSYHNSAEIMFRKGIARSKILRIVCQSESARKDLIQAAKAAGIVEYNGVSIESFIVLAHSCNDAFVKAVQPALAKAAEAAGK